MEWVIFKIDQNKKKKTFKNSPQRLTIFSFLPPSKYTGKIIPTRELERTCTQMTHVKMLLWRNESHMQL